MKINNEFTIKLFVDDGYIDHVENQIFKIKHPFGKC